MVAFEKIQSGIPELDKTLDYMRLGDNVVWHVSNIEEFKYFAYPFINQAKKDNRNLIYINFAQHDPVIELSKEDSLELEKKLKSFDSNSAMIERDGLKIYRLNPFVQFESFTLEVHNIIKKEGFDAFYVFDCLSDLQSAWSTDLMMGNFFKVTCPFLFKLDTVAYFPILRGRHSFDAIAKIRETTQLLIDVFADADDIYVYPLKVWNRYSQTMFLGHKYNPKIGSVKSLKDGLEVSKFYKAINKANSYYNEQSTDSWERFVSLVRLKYQNGEDVTEDCNLMCDFMMTKDKKILDKIKKYFTPEDYFLIYNHVVGSGMIGGKACGMLLARKIIEVTRPDLYYYFEPDDSFYIGSDLFYTYIVANDLWDLRVKQRTKEGYYKYGQELEEELKNGTFSEEIKNKFIQVLEYFGQSPIIVRSSSFLEDGFGNAFAGKYESVFCVNKGNMEERLEAFENAVKTVYASTMNISALEYRELNDLADVDEQMGLLVQRVSGSYYDDYFFPTAAGVGFSYSSYCPLPDMDNSAGMLRLVMGLGTRAVDRTENDYPRIINLDRPRAIFTSDIAERHRYSQHYLDVLDLEDISIHDIPIDNALDIVPGYAKRCLVEHDIEAERMFRERGQKREVVFVNCNGLVNNNEFIKVMKEILETLQKAYNYPVDIEYTVNVGQNNEFVINLLQCRPLKISNSDEEIRMPEEKNVYFHIKDASMGSSRKEKIDLVCYVDPYKYYKYPYSKKSSISSVIRSVNDYIKQNDLNAMLIVPGRIGTSSPELGIPVVFADISKFSAILEESYSEIGYMPELSFGSHMFQDLVEANIFYGAIFENEKRIEFNKDIFIGYENKLEDINPNLDKEVYNMVKIVKIPTDKDFEFYHNMENNESMAVLKKN